MRKINGGELKSMLISGANNLYNQYPKIDSLNVFPVPDGDTGTNMNLTFSSGIKEIANLHSANIGDVSKSFSRGLLMGARGNSGVILSQIFKGISLQLENHDSIGSVELAKAFVKGQKIAYKAVMRPVEGTILTVIREASDATLKEVKHSNSIEETLNIFVKNARISLENTPNLLPVLKEVGVVDSGGYGLVTVFEGMLAHIEGKPVEKNTDSNINIDSQVFIDNHDGQYGYCTEYIIKLDSEKAAFDENELRGYLSDLGDSLVVVSDDDIVKIHVHTLDPGRALSKAVTYGDMINIKIENMQEQALEIERNKKQTLKEQAIIAVSSGEGIDKMFKELRVDAIISGGQTMNPSTQDFIDTIDKLNAKKIIILPNNSNIILAAKQAAEVIEDVVVEVIDTKTIMQGMVACINYNPDALFEENLDEMKAAITSIKSGEVTHAIKNTMFNGVSIKKNDFMGIYEKDVVANGKNILNITKKLIETMIDEDSEIITLVYGIDAKKIYIDVVKYIEDELDLEVEVINGKQALYPFYIGVE